MSNTYLCCPGGAEIEIDPIAAGQESAMCPRCGRWFLSDAGPVSRGRAPRLPGDVFIALDGTFHTTQRFVRDLLNDLASDTPEGRR